MTTASVEFKGVSKRYLGHQAALEDVTFRLPQGKMIGLIGANGSGKSTMLKLMAGLIRPSTGTVHVNGQPVKRRMAAEVSFASDQDLVYDFYSIHEIVAFYQGVFADFDRERADKLLSFLELSPEKGIRTLSKGNMGRLKIALALSRRAPLVLMDEPLSGLDPIVRKSIIKGIISFIDLDAQTVILSTHEVTEVEPLLDTVVLVDNGHLRAVRDVEDIQANCGQGVVDWMADMLAARSQ